MPAWRSSDVNFLPRRPIRSLSIRKAAVATVWIASSSSLAKEHPDSRVELSAGGDNLVDVQGGWRRMHSRSLVCSVARGTKTFEPGSEQPLVPSTVTLGLRRRVDPNFKMTRVLDGPSQNFGPL